MTGPASVGGKRLTKEEGKARRFRLLELRYMGQRGIDAYTLLL